MTRTIVASATREIVIGFDQPFCVIGERINPTGRKKLAAEMQAGNFETVIKDALEQAGAWSAGSDAGDRAGPGRPATVDRLLRHRSDRGRPQGRQGSPAGKLGHWRGRETRSDPAFGEEVQCAGGCHLQRRDRHFDGPGRALRRRQEDRRTRHGSWHQAGRRRRRSAGHADR